MEASHIQPARPEARIAESIEELPVASACLVPPILQVGTLPAGLFAIFQSRLCPTMLLRWSMLCTLVTPLILIGVAAQQACDGIAQEWVDWGMGVPPGI